LIYAVITFITRYDLLFLLKQSQKIITVLKKISFICNDKEIITEIHPATTLLDFLRKNLSLTGTKEGCREGDCGACTILVGELSGDEVVYKTMNSCLLPIGSVIGKHVVSIEGLNMERLSPVQMAMVEEGGTQCGFCTPGFIISLSAYFLTHKTYNPEEAVESLDGNICRCTGHTAIKRAAARSVDFFNEHKGESLVSAGLLPPYFSDIPARLKTLAGQIQSNGGQDILPRYQVGGGTDLFVQKWEDLYRSDVGFINNNGNDQKITISGRECIINASATVTDIMNSEILLKYFPGIKSYFSLFGSLPIRNRATLGGNIVNASPIADMTNFFLALNSKIQLVGANALASKKKNGSRSREVYLKDFYLGYKTLDKKPDEIIKSLSFKLPSPDSMFSYEKVSRRTYLDIASVNTSLFVETKNNIINEIHISAGGVAPVPLYLIKTREFLLNKKIEPGIIAEAARIAVSESSPITDARGSVRYKKLLLRQLIFAHFLKLFPRMVNYEELI
jgi:xanthine dehydrogenase small subunit